MPYPERLREWMAQDPVNNRIVVALVQGAAAGALAPELGLLPGCEAEARGYASRSAVGDAFEEAFLFGEEEAKRQWALHFAEVDEARRRDETLDQWLQEQE